MNSGPCPICSSKSNLKEKLTIPDFNLENFYKILECPNCTIKQTSPIPEELDKYYSPGTYQQFYPHWRFFLKSILLRQEIKRFRWLNHEPKKFLDVGCGNGDFSFNLFKAGFNVAGADFSSERPYYIKDCPQIPYCKFDYNNYQIEDPGLITGRAVILRHVLEHIKKPLEFLNYLISYKPSYLYIVSPNADCLERKIFKEYCVLWNPPQHIWHFNKKSLKELMVNRIHAQIVSEGFDSIPTTFLNLRFLLAAKKYPELILKILYNDGIALSMSLLTNFLSLNNVVWVLAKVNN